MNDSMFFKNFSAEEWISGRNASPILMSLKAGSRIRTYKPVVYKPSENSIVASDKVPFIYYVSIEGGWVGGVGQMLTFAYIVGGWVKANAYVSKKMPKTCLRNIRMVPYKIKILCNQKSKKKITAL